MAAVDKVLSFYYDDEAQQLDICFTSGAEWMYRVSAGLMGGFEGIEPIEPALLDLLRKNNLVGVRVK